MLDSAQLQVEMQEKILLFWCASFIGALGIIVGWRQGFFHRFQASSIPAIRGKDVFRGFCYFLFIELLLAPAVVILAAKVFGVDMSDNMGTQMKGLLYLLITIGGFIGVSLAFFELPAQQRSEIWSQDDVSWLWQVCIGISAFLISYPVVLAFSQAVSIAIWHFFQSSFVEQAAVVHFRALLDYPFLFLPTAFSVIILVPITEEYLFRGLLQGWLKRKFHHTAAAIVVSSIIFALFHFSVDYGITNIELLTSLFLLSCMLGYIYERQRSLWAPIGLHSVFNAWNVAMIFFEPKEG